MTSGPVVSGLKILGQEKALLVSVTTAVVFAIYGNQLQGAVHILLFLAYIMLIFD